MISGVFHKGSGLGNQLHRYVMTRVLALDKGFDWGMIGVENCKASSFMMLDMGKEPKGIEHSYLEKRTNNEKGVDIRDYDWEGVLNIRDNTWVDGEFQGQKYFIHHMDKIRKWLHVEPIDIDDDTCIINFRGGEYTLYPDLFLTIDYWNLAISRMIEINPYMKFRVVTDDVATAQVFFPNYDISHNISEDWRSIRYAKYVILSNSSFGILPALLNERAEEIIAPKNWARRNIGVQALAYNVYDTFTHI